MDQNHQDFNPLHPSMPFVLIVLFIMFCLTFLIMAYAKFCHRAQSQPSDLPQHVVTIGSRPRFSGIEKALIESLPFFKFSSLKGSKQGLECAVCLSRFEESDLLRLLPKCSHAFHTVCIDKWLEIHSNCPLCRLKFDASDLKSSSFREGPNVEFFIQREENHGMSSRFNLANTFQRIQEFKNQRKIPLHNVKHKILVSEVMHKSRWSDVNSSDMLSLNSEIIGVVSREGLNEGVEVEEKIAKIKEDMERKRVFEAKIGGRNESSGGESSCCYENDMDMNLFVSKSLDSGEKRSMSEITNVSRFGEVNSSTCSRINGLSTCLNSEKDEKVRRIWLPIARRTIQMFSAQETTSSDKGQCRFDV